jgi:hypothetical protein
MNDHGASTPNASKKPLPAGFKLVIGCLAAFFALATVAVVVLGVGGFWLKNKAGDVLEGVQARANAQQEAGALLDRLRNDYAFVTPADGRIDPASADRFFRAVALAWAPLESTMRRLEAASDRTRDGRAAISDVIEGVKASGVLVDSRVHIARALDEAGMSLEEFVWTGGALRGVWRDVRTTDGQHGVGTTEDGVLRANAALAERYRERLETMEKSREVNPSAILDLAILWAGALPGMQPRPR